MRDELRHQPSQAAVSCSVTTVDWIIRRPAPLYTNSLERSRVPSILRPLAVRGMGAGRVNFLYAPPEGKKVSIILLDLNSFNFFCAFFDVKVHVV